MWDDGGDSMEDFLKDMNEFDFEPRQRKGGRGGRKKGRMSDFYDDDDFVCTCIHTYIHTFL